jgi:hypothetical protein
MTLLNACITQLKEQKPPSCKPRASRDHQRQCPIMILGSLMNSIPTKELQSILAHGLASKYYQSANHLIKVIENISAEELNPKHGICNPIPEIMEKIRAKKEQVEKSILTKEYINYLSRQKKKTGLKIKLWLYEPYEVEHK